MKLVRLKFAIKVFLMLFILFTSKSYSTIHNVSVSNFQFSPPNLNVTVGDTVKWNWVSGFHTTTCNGTSGTTRPSGAAAWNADISSGSPTFSYVVTVPGSYHYVCLPHAPEMAGNINADPSGISQLTEIVNGYELSQNFPNPFNPATNIKFSIPSAAFVKLSVFNNSGKTVETLVNEKLMSGTYQVDWNAVNLPSGVYFYKLETDNFINVRKMLLVK